MPAANSCIANLEDRETEDRENEDRENEDRETPIKLCLPVQIVTANVHPRP
jgi:hypothetical protein